MSRAADSRAIAMLPDRAALFAALFIAALFAFPPKAFSPEVYAGGVLVLSALYFVFNAATVVRRGLFREYWALAGLAVLCLLVSQLRWMHPEGWLFDARRILPQAAGLLIILVTMPLLTDAIGKAFMPRIQWITLMLVLGAMLVSILVWQLQDGGIFVDGGLYGANAAPLMVQFIIILLALRVRHPALRLILLALPIPFMRSATNLILQIAALLIAGTRIRGPALLLLAALLAAFTLLMVAQPDILRPWLDSDPNALVRSHLWGHAAAEVLRLPLGVGYGSAYLPHSAFGDEIVRSVYSQDPMRALFVANHHSFIDLALRLGWVGMAAFAVLLWRLWEEARHSAMRLEAAIMLAAVLICCAFNPMIESARSAPFIGFALAYLRAAAFTDPRKLPAPGQETALPLPTAALTPRERRRRLAEASGTPAG